MLEPKGAVQQGPAQLTRRCFVTRVLTTAMAQGAVGRVTLWMRQGCLSSGARANLPTVLSEFWGFPTVRSVFGVLALDNIPLHSTCRLQQLTLHTRGRAAAPQRCNQHRATPATNQQRATGLAPSTSRRQRMLPCKPTRRESRAAVPSICSFMAGTSVQILQVRDPALPRWLHCDCAWRRPHRNGAHLGADDLVSRFPVI